MNLPENKEERNKVLLIIGIVAVAVCYAGYMFGIAPMQKKKKDYAAKIEELNDKIWRAEKTIRTTEQLKKDNRDIIHKIIGISEDKRYILHPNLGNYLLVAGNIIREQADSLNLKIDNITEPPDKNKMPDNYDPEDPDSPRFRPYTVTVTLKCGYYDLVKLLKQIESNNPYLCITRIGIINREDDNLHHSVSFDVQWPVWINEQQPIKLIAEQMNNK